MGHVQINVTSRDVYWVTCQHCDYRSENVLTKTEAYQLEAEHHRSHAGQCYATSHGLRCERTSNHGGRHAVTHEWDDTPPAPPRRAPNA